LKLIRGVIFFYEPEVKIKELLSCHHVEDEAPDEDDSHKIYITEIEAERERWKFLLCS
jgi:hypothetical protein